VRAFSFAFSSKPVKITSSMLTVSMICSLRAGLEKLDNAISDEAALK